MVTNNKPQDRVATHSQGTINKGYSNNTTGEQLKDSRSRYDKGMEIYRAGRVQLTPSGIFKVSGMYYADAEKMTCDCPDYKTRKESCKHIFAALLFVKNRGKQSIEHLAEHDPDEQVPHEWVDTTEPRRLKNDAPNKPVEAQKQADNKPFDRQATITRLAVINSAIELLKTHRTPLEPETVIAVAGQLEKWALGGGNV